MGPVRRRPAVPWRSSRPAPTGAAPRSRGKGRTARNEEPPRPASPRLRSVVDPDSRTRLDRHGHPAGPDLESQRRCWVAQVEAVVGAIYREGVAYEARPAGQALPGHALQAAPGPIDSVIAATARPVHGDADPSSAHGIDAGYRFDGSDQHRRRASGGLRDNVQTVVHAVDKVHVRDSRRPEHDLIPPGPAESGVGGEVVLADVGLYLDDSSDAGFRTSASHEERSQQTPGALLSVAAEDCAGKHIPRNHGYTVGRYGCRRGFAQGKIETRSGGRSGPRMWTNGGATWSRKATPMWDSCTSILWASRTCVRSPERGCGSG